MLTVGEVKHYSLFKVDQILSEMSKSNENASPISEQSYVCMYVEQSYILCRSWFGSPEWDQ